MNGKKKLISILKAILSWGVISLPVLLFLLCHTGLLLSFRYTKLDTDAVLWLYLLIEVATLAPTILYVICWLTLFRRGKAEWLRWTLVVICVLYLRVSVFGQTLLLFAPPLYSETANPAHYMALDDLGDYEVGLMYDLFPEEPHEPITAYYYRYMHSIDPNYEIYAEWTLTSEELAAEKQRIAELYACQEKAYWTVETVQQGDYTCMICYENQPPFSLEGDSQYYIHAIFAYDETTGTVRYIFNYGVDVPEKLLPRCFALPW